jgi:formamidopyrimidine-DNA glycosylase
MPELPEVEIMTRNARTWMQGARVVSVDTNDSALMPTDWSVLGGQIVNAVERVAKVMVLHLDEHVVTVHFRMTGKWVRLPHSRTPRISLSLSTPDSTSRVNVGLIDTRRLGRVELIDADAWSTLPERLGHGPEPYPNALPWTVWRERLQTRAAIKVALLDGVRISGLGNICASEILWRAGISPDLPAQELSPAQLERLSAVATPWLHEVIAEESADEIGYVNETGTMPEAFAIYGREGEPCRTCGETIERVVQGGRSTFLCRRCQRGSERRATT